MVNKVILIGNVGADPVIRCFDNGNQVARVCLITSERYKDKDGNKREQSELHNVEAWGQPAGIIDQYVRKGDRLYIEGQLHYEEYTSQNGEKRQRTTIRLRELKLLTPKQKQEETQQEQPQAQATPEPPQVPLPPMPDDIDGLPF
jgi:single-strand DNA-binding protein